MYEGWVDHESNVPHTCIISPAAHVHHQSNVPRTCIRSRRRSRLLHPLGHSLILLVTSAPAEKEDLTSPKFLKKIPKKIGMQPAEAAYYSIIVLYYSIIIIFF